MLMRVDRLITKVPTPTKQDPNAAAALQELLGGKYGEMSTLGNYMFQSFVFRSKDKLRPFYSLVASITVEELAHVESVSNGVAMLNNGPDKPNGMRSQAAISQNRPSRRWRTSASLPLFFRTVATNGASWNNDFITTTGMSSLIHNFHLECGARLHKPPVCETLSADTRLVARCAAIFWYS